MSARILVAARDPVVAGELRALAEEAGDIELSATASDVGGAVAALARAEPDAVVVHEDLGPLPVLDLARELTSGHPSVAFVLLAREVTPDLLRQALRAGVRDVLALPLTVEALAEAVASAAAWSRAVRDRMDDEGLAQVAERIGGRVVAVAGAKGGVGTSTVALHLALAAARAGAERVVCLAELDLQAGDLRSFLDVTSRRSIADLVAVADELTARSLDETLYVDRSGLRVLFGPEAGEDAEEVDAGATRQILSALRFQYDLVVCDVGTVVSEAGAVASELADEVLVVATPDVPALRAANRLVGLWERLQVRSEGTRLVLNRTHRDAEVQPDLARAVSTIPLAETTIPAGFRELEAALNTGAPGRLQAGPVQRALNELAQEVGAVAPASRRRRLRLRVGARAQAGQATVETAGLTFVVGLLLLALWQVLLTGYTFQLAGHSAREGARALAVGEDYRGRAREDLPKAWRRKLRVVRSSDAVKVTLRVPLVVPGVETPVKVSDRERTVVEDEPLPEELRR